MYIFRLLAFTFLLPATILVSAETSTDKWISLFNGKDLSGWTIKIAGQDLGVNYKNTFSVEDGVIKVSYAEYKTFNNDFGHLFYEKPFSNYHFRLEYRFTGEQTPGAPEWAYRNSGIMFHSQSPQSMRKDQSFPVCVEFQTLGGNGKDKRSTGNMCSPGSHITLNGELNTNHCITSSSDTYHGDQWVKAELLVKDGIIKHIINGKTVFEYSNPVLDEGDADAKALHAAGAPLAMTSGYIALQAEGHNVEYRNVEIMPLTSTK